MLERRCGRFDCHEGDSELVTAVAPIIGSTPGASRQIEQQELRVVSRSNDAER
jgi:hypothetical protein